MNNETKFTEGEWVADYGTVSCGDIAIADCELNSISYTPTEVANAHLIAAAPEMYHELQNLLHDSMDCDEYNRIEKLLSKARGEA